MRRSALIAVLLSALLARPALADRLRLSRPMASPPDLVEEEAPPAPVISLPGTKSVAPEQPKAAPLSAEAPKRQPRGWEIAVAPEFATGCCSLGVDLSVSRSVKLNEALKLEFQVNAAQGDFLTAGTPYSAGGEVRFSAVTVKDRLTLAASAGGTGELAARGGWSVPLGLAATLGGFHKINEWEFAVRLSAGATPGSAGTRFDGGAVVGYERETSSGFADFSVRLNGEYALSGESSEKAGLDTTFHLSSVLAVELTPMVVLSQTPGKTENGVAIAATHSVAFDATLTFIAMF